MIRNPLQTALSRGSTTAARPDLVRVAEGISASLRSFSVAASRRAASNDNSNSKTPSTSSPPSSSSSAASPSSANSRQRASSAVDSLISKAEQSVRTLQRSPGRGGAPLAPSTRGGGATAGGPNIIRVTSLRGRGGLRGRGAFAGAGTGATRNPPGPSGVTVRPGADYNARPPRTSPSGAGLNMGINISEGNDFQRFGPRDGNGSGRGGGMFRGGRVNRGGRGGRRRGGRDGGRERGRDGAVDGGRGGGDKYDSRRLDPLFVTDEEAAYVARLEEGVASVYDPSFTLESLHGYAPAVATSNSPFGYAATAMTQARMLSGGQPYEHENHVLPEEALARSKQGAQGVLFPSKESRAWTQEFTTAEGVQYKSANDETKQAVLEAALQGKYDAPQAVKLGDTLSLVQNYARKDTRVYGQSGRTIHDKIKSLLPQEAAAGKAKAAAKAKA